MRYCCHALKRIAGCASFNAYCMFCLSVTYCLPVMTQLQNTTMYPFFSLDYFKWTIGGQSNNYSSPGRPPQLAMLLRSLPELIVLCMPLTHITFLFPHRPQFFLIIIPAQDFHQHLRNFIVTYIDIIFIIVHVHGEFGKIRDLLSGGLGLGSELGHRLR